jgi:phosphoribosylformimino-5-aminoimidazole carboxamide ribotide isomerase
MRVIGVIDLLRTRAVHARAGVREEYAPVTAVAGVPIEPGSALGLAREYIDCFGLTELYVADLDAILGGAPQETSVTALVALGAALWLDAGVSSVEDARNASGLGSTRVIVGLETLPSYVALTEICAQVDDVAFSLDLRNGEPIAMNAAMRIEPAAQIAARAADAGASAVIVVDLARVGTGRLLDLRLIERVRRAVPDVILVSGGGVREFQDVDRLADAGCDGVLVATAFHEGRLGPDDVAMARRLGRPRQDSATR